MNRIKRMAKYLEDNTGLMVVMIISSGICGIFISLTFIIWTIPPSEILRAMAVLALITLTGVLIAFIKTKTTIKPAYSIRLEKLASLRAVDRKFYGDGKKPNNEDCYYSTGNIYEVRGWHETDEALRKRVMEKFTDQSQRMTEEEKK